MVSIGFNRFSEMVAKKAISGSGVLAVLLAFGNVNAQTYTFNEDNFLVSSKPPVTECSGDHCGGEIFLRMGEPAIADGRASIGIWLRVELAPALADVTPYLGNYVFHVATGGPGIILKRLECTFVVADGVQAAYNPPGLATGSVDPRSMALANFAPGFGASVPTDTSHYTLSTREFEQFGTFSCPIADTNGVNAYILEPSNVFGFTIQAGRGDQHQLLLRADNSYRYFSLNGEPAFVLPGGTPDGTVATLNVINNLPGVLSSITTEFTACDAGTSVVTDNDDGSRTITTTFEGSQTDNGCTIIYTVTLPDGSTYTYEQVIGTPGALSEQLARAQARYVSGGLAAYGVYLNEGGPGEARVRAPAVGDIVSPGIAVRDALTAAAAGQTLEQLRAVAGGALTGAGVQSLLNANAVMALTDLDPLSSVQLTMNAYSFSGTVTDVVTTQVSFVINLANDSMAGSGGLTTSTRLVKQLKSGDWRGVVNSDADGTVSYLPGCPLNLDALGWLPTASSDTAVDGLIPASAENPVSCIRITIVDGGMYDADGTAIGENRVGFISDPITEISASASSGIPNAGGSAGAWTIMALLTVLGLSMWRRRSRVAVRSEL